MKATIDKNKWSILEEEPVIDGFDGPFDRGSSSRERAARPVRAMVVGVMAIVASAAMFVWATLGDSGVQLVETERASPATTLPPPSRDKASARSRIDRSALVVDIDRLDLDSDTGPAPFTAPTTTAPTTTAPTTTAGEGTDTVNETGSASPTGPSISSSTVAVGSPQGALRRAEPAATTFDSIRGSATAPTLTTETPVGTAPPSTQTPTSIPMSTPAGSASGVAWEEHFNSLDTGRWQVEHSTYGDGNGERQCYQPENVRVTNGRLVLTARAETATCPNGSTRTVTSGMVRSRGLSFSPGQAIEFRVRLTPPDPSNQAGLWPAVWASSWAGSWPRGGELDFLEVMTAEDPRRAVFSMHYADRSGSHELQNRGVPLAGYFSDGWHTIRFDYGRHGNLAWFLDGSKVFSVSAADTVQGYPAPFDQTIHEIKVNLAVGGSPGPLAPGALGSTGATFEIDYIKVSDL